MYDKVSLNHVEHELTYSSKYHLSVVACSFRDSRRDNTAFISLISSIVILVIGLVKGCLWQGDRREIRWVRGEDFLNFIMVKILFITVCLATTSIFTVKRDGFYRNNFSLIINTFAEVFVTWENFRNL